MEAKEQRIKICLSSEAAQEKKQYRPHLPKREQCLLFFLHQRVLDQDTVPGMHVPASVSCNNAYGEITKMYGTELT
jgi:hypothetical protein